MKSALDVLNEKLIVYRHEQKVIEDAIRDCTEQIRKIHAAAWIKKHNVTIDKVERVNGERKPWFLVAQEFAKWIEKHSNKLFVEWNDYVYLRSDFLNINLVEGCRVSDLECITQGAGK